MEITAEVLAEDVQSKEKAEYVTITCRELGTHPLLQMIDYGLRGEELQYKGKLIGKTVKIHIKTIRGIFSGRPQTNGSLTLVTK